MDLDALGPPELDELVRVLFRSVACPPLSYIMCVIQLREMMREMTENAQSTNYPLAGKVEYAPLANSFPN